MMRRWWHLLALGIAAWLVFLLWRLPAGVAYAMAAPAAGGAVTLVGVHGTLWSGGAQQLGYRGQGIAAAEWQLSPWGLLLGRVSGSLRLQNSDAGLQVELAMPLGGGEVELAELQGRLPLPLLQRYLTMVPVPLKGELSLKLDELVIGEGGRLQGAQGRMVWHGAGVQVNEVLPLGDLQMRLENGEEGGITGTISDSGGPLQLAATLALAADGGYRLQGSATPNDATPEALRGMLPMLGKPDSQGGYPLNFSGRL